MANLDYPQWENLSNESSTVRDGAVSWKSFVPMTSCFNRSPVWLTVKFAEKVVIHSGYIRELLNQNLQSCTRMQRVNVKQEKILTFMTDVEEKITKCRGKNSTMKRRPVPHILYRTGGRASQLVLCVPADNYLVPTESSIHCAGSLNWLTRNEFMATYSDRRPGGMPLCRNYSLKYVSVSLAFAPFNKLSVSWQSAMLITRSDWELCIFLCCY